MFEKHAFLHGKDMHFYVPVCLPVPPRLFCLLATFYINKKDVSHPLNRPWGVMTLDLLTGIISSLNNQPATLLGDSDDAF